MDSKILKALGIDPALIFLFLLVLIVILFVLYVNVTMKYNRLKSSYTTFMRGKDGKTLEESMMSGFSDVEAILKYTKQNRTDIQKLNKKMFRAGMASIYSKLVADARFVVVETIKADLPKTKAFASQLKTLGLTARTLIIVDESELDDNLILASRNLKDVLVVTPRFADPLCLIYFDKVVATKAAVAQIQEMLA